MKPTLLLPALVSVLAAGLIAQSPRLSPAATPSDGFVALLEDEGVLWGLGEDYRTRFLPSGIEFQPLLGKGEPVTRHLRFEMTASGRESQMLTAAAPKRRMADLVTQFVRGDVTEVYEVRADGLKQSFVFANKPAGQGDLVVRGELDTNMVLGGANSTGIRFDATHGHVTIGRVIGWDATGRQVEGSLRLDGPVLEMRLPGSFVDTAVAPITLDPVIGSTNTVSSGDEYRPDVAYDASNDVFLVVWYREVSSTDVDIRAQRVDASGANQGNGIGVRTGSDSSLVPRVANNNRRDCFVVAWHEDDGVGALARDIFARAISASNGSQGSVRTVANGSADEYGVEVGGNRGTGTGNADARVVLAWTKASANPNAELRAASLTIDSSLNLTIAAERMVGWGGYDSKNPAISDMTDDNHAWWIVWDSFHFDIVNGVPTQYYSSGQRDIMSSYVDSLLNNEMGGDLLRIVDGVDDYDSLIWYANGFAAPVEPSIAGSGTEWIVAYQVRNAAATNSYQVDAAAIETATRHGNDPFLAYAARTIAQTGSVDYRHAEVAWGAESVLIGYVETDSGGSTDPWLWEGDLDCDSCGALTQVSSSGDIDVITIATKTGAGGGVTGGEVSLLAFDRNAGSTESVRTKRFRSDDGITENLGGACGTGTTTRLYSDCAVVGNGDHDLRIMNSRKNINALCVIGFDELSSSCGSCTLRLNPYTAWAFTVTTDGAGYGSKSFSIPNEPALSGLAYLHQWIVPQVAASAGCSILSADFTDAFRVTIQ
ncbi:MAG: hypothetical protein NXI31_04330 [bacterium]|nr:hypothetical protein [bacterium]